MSLPARNFGDVKAAFETVIDILGTVATWRQKAPPERSILMPIGARIVGRTEHEVINAVGIHGRILTVRAIDFDGARPEKFDVFEIGAEPWIANAVQDIWINGTLVGWKIYARARQG